MLRVLKPHKRNLSLMYPQLLLNLSRYTVRDISAIERKIFWLSEKFSLFFLFCNKPALVDRSEPVTRESKLVQPAPNASKTFFLVYQATRNFINPNTNYSHCNKRRNRERFRQCLECTFADNMQALKCKLFSLGFSSGDSRVDSDKSVRITNRCWGSNQFR